MQGSTKCAIDHKLSAAFVLLVHYSHNLVAIKIERLRYQNRISIACKLQHNRIACYNFPHEIEVIRIIVLHLLQL